MATLSKVKKASIEIRENSKRDHSPNWEGNENWNSETFGKFFRAAMKYYNMEHSAKVLKPIVLKWMALNGYSKDEIAAFKRTKDWRCNLTMGAIASCMLRGMPHVRIDFNSGKSTAGWLDTEIRKAIAQGKNDIDEEALALAAASKSLTNPVNIQERTRDAALVMTTELEDAIESFQTDPENFDPKSFKVLSLLKGKGAKAAHARIIRDLYSKQLNELNELASGKADDQLKEAYKHRSRKQIKSFIAFLTEIQTACGMLLEEAKVVRKVRTPKAVSKDKLVAKVKYKKTDEQLKLVSINPVDIIGAKELWCFNTKTRKLGKYVAEEYKELAIKGTTIINFNEAASIQKTLRKPVEQLADFKASGKVVLRKFLDGINAVDTKMNGRISEDIILLKVV